jgi:hypothetical protein
MFNLAQIMLQYCIYGNTSVQYSDRRAVSEINDLILFITPMDFDIFRETLLICGFPLTKISHSISYMKISYMKSLYGIETNFIYEIFHI